MSFDKFSKRELINLVETLVAKVDSLEKKVESLEKKVGELQEENRLLKVSKNSSNSSKPPSTDISKRNQSLRPKSENKRGGQHGHKGSTLEMWAIPSEIILHKPHFCGDCGLQVSDLPATITDRRQVIDIPPIIPVCTEHRICSITCRCGRVCKSSFPANINAPMQYGENIESLAAYFSARQYMPYKRMQECFSDIFGVKMSQGSLVNSVRRFAEKAVPFYNRIKEAIQEAAVVGSDETGAKVNGKKGWYFTWQNTASTFISFSFSRGFNTIKNLFSEGFTKSVMVSDCLAAQLKVDAKAHQICVAHLMRELNFFIESNMGQWPLKFKELLKESLELKEKNIDYDVPIAQRQKIEANLNQLLEQQLSENPKLKAFQKRLRKHREKILTFLYYKDVPADNNGSERAIRNVKVKQKISGQFVSEDKAQNFAIIRSVIDTLIKNDFNIMDSMKIIAHHKMT